MTSTFAQLNYEHADSAGMYGLRYDQFRLKGNTWMQSKSYLATIPVKTHATQRYMSNILLKTGGAPQINIVLEMTWDVDLPEQQLSPHLLSVSNLCAVAGVFW